MVSPACGVEVLRGRSAGPRASEGQAEHGRGDDSPKAHGLQPSRPFPVWWGLGIGGRSAYGTLVNVGGDRSAVDESERGLDAEVRRVGVPFGVK